MRSSFGQTNVSEPNTKVEVKSGETKVVHTTGSAEQIAEKIVDRYGILGIVVLFLIWLGYTWNKSLLPLLVKKYEKQTELIEQTTGAIGKVSETQVAAGKTMDAIREHVEANLTESQRTNGGVGEVVKKIERIQETLEETKGMVDQVQRQTEKKR